VNELQVLIKTNLPAILQNNELGKEEKKMFAIGVAKLSGAKNIQLLDGTLMIWENCLVQDMERGLFTFNEFFEAMDVSIRKTAYNRLDYADLYKEAIKISYEKYNQNKKFIKCINCGQEHIKMEGLISNLYQNLKCGGSYEELRGKEEYQGIIYNLKNLEKEYYLL